ncbi:MAG: DUF6290 family protein [Pyramidobacter sp.]
METVVKKFNSNSRQAVKKSAQRWNCLCFNDDHKLKKEVVSLTLFDLTDHRPIHGAKNKFLSPTAKDLELFKKLTKHLETIKPDKRGGTMCRTPTPQETTTIEIKLPSRALRFLEGYAAGKNTTVPECIAAIIAEWIEDEEDLQAARVALAEYEADPTVYTSEEAHAFWERCDKEKELPR